MEQKKPLVLVELPIPSLDVGQVLVKIEYSGICGKHLDEISGKQGPDPYLPHLLGHEGAGIVEEIGPGVRTLQSGDHVVVHWTQGVGIDSAPPRFMWIDTVVSAGWATTFPRKRTFQLAELLLVTGIIVGYGFAVVSLGIFDGLFDEVRVHPNVSRCPPFPALARRREVPRAGFRSRRARKPR